MAATTQPLSLATVAATQASRIPWYLWSLTAAIVLVTAGGQADVSWHRSVGRDGFWIPPHMMVYACGLLAGASCAYLILASTFSRSRHLRAHSVQLLGLRAPLGIFLTAWGGMVMLYSAVFDNWWHNAYGLDVQVASPPHIVLLSGTWAVTIGTLLVAAAHMNRARIAACDEAQTRSYRRLFLFVGAFAAIHLMSYSMTYTFDTRLHTAKPYLVMSTGVPFVLAAVATALRTRRQSWTATTIAAIYTGFMLVMVWGLPLVPATPHLGPVYQTVTHMVPPKFPILLLAPCIALDLLWRHRSVMPWRTAAISGFAYVGALLMAEWPFATFLMSPAAANRFFAARMLDFSTPSTSYDALRQFEPMQHAPQLAGGLMLAVLAAVLAIGTGQLCGKWMRDVYR